MQNTIIPPYFPKPTIQNNNEDEEEDQQLLYSYDDNQQLDNLSLRDLPVAVDPLPSQRNGVAGDHNRRSSTSSSSDPTSDFFFEFLINNDDDLVTSTADDVIFRGRLLPYTPPPPPTRRSLSLSSAAVRLTRPQLTESPAETLPCSIRPSRSLNYRKLRRNRSSAKPKTEVLHRGVWNNNNNNNNSRCNNSDKSPAKLPWYSALVFGLPKIPAEMELKDIKNRQFRRNFKPTSSLSKLISGDRSCSSASWKLLNVLSCKSHVTVDVSNTAPFRNSLI